MAPKLGFRPNHERRSQHDLAVEACESDLLYRIHARPAPLTAGNNPGSGGMVSRVSGGYRAGTGYHGGAYGVQGMSVGIGAGRASLIAKGHSDAVIRGQERTAGASTVQDIWQGIDEGLADIRRKLTLKYQIEF